MCADVAQGLVAVKIYFRGDAPEAPAPWILGLDLLLDQTVSLTRVNIVNELLELKPREDTQHL